MGIPRRRQGVRDGLPGSLISLDTLGVNRLSVGSQAQSGSRARRLALGEGQRSLALHQRHNHHREDHRNHHRRIEAPRAPAGQQQHGGPQAAGKRAARTPCFGRLVDCGLRIVDCRLRKLAVRPSERVVGELGDGGDLLGEAGEVGLDVGLQVRAVTLLGERQVHRQAQREALPIDPQLAAARHLPEAIRRLQGHVQRQLAPLAELLLELVAQVDGQGRAV
jgi:hypothetical protein